MKIYVWVMFLMFGASANAEALQSKVEIYESFDNLKVVAFVNKKDINDSPKWNPETDAPPLSIKQAIQSINTFNNNKKITGDVKEIEVRNTTGNPGSWHYLIKTENKKLKNRKYKIYVVLMSGKVIPAIIEPESYK